VTPPHVDPADITTRTDPYGTPYAEFPPVIITTLGRSIHAHRIYWDGSYFHAQGVYGKTNGQPSRQAANTPVGSAEIPATVLAALRDIIPAPR